MARNKNKGDISRRSLFTAGTILGVGTLAGCTAKLEPTPTASAASSATASATPSTPTTAELVKSIPAPETVASKYANETPTQWGLDIPGVYTHLTPGPKPTAALTLDACGGPEGSGYDQALIDGLKQRNVKATLFINSRWIDANPELFKELAANPLFEIGNHGTSHMPLSVTGQSAYGIQGTDSALAAAQEVYGNTVKLTELTGKKPKYFRSGTAFYDDVAIKISEDGYGEKVVGFNVNSDAGATFTPEQVQSQVEDAPDGAVIIGHMNQPQGGTAGGMLPGIDALLARGYTFEFLDKLAK